MTTTRLHSTSPPLPGASRPTVLRAHFGLIALFVVTTFTASALLFLVQPMIAKMALPRLGGSPSVWNTCVLFFQTALLLGYLYAHLTVRWFGAHRQAFFHLALMLIPVLLLPLTIGNNTPPPGASPAWWLLYVLTKRVGLPFLAVATMAPLVQRWFSTLPVPSASDPYFLYAASNFGSMLALLAFPFLLEPAFGVKAQASTWSIGYVVLIVLASACAYVVWKRGTDVHQPIAASETETSVSQEQRVFWVLLSFAPSSLMLGVTTHISIDLAPVPLLWVLPLALYLATFILAFSGEPGRGTHLLTRAFPILALVSLASILIQSQSRYMILVHLVTFFMGALMCHRQLADRRPAPSHLTEFYLWLSFGGMLGGVFNTLIAPLLFKWVFEYPLVLALACLLRPAALRRKRNPAPWPLILMTGVVPLAVAAAMWTAGSLSREIVVRTFLLVALQLAATIWALTHRKSPFTVLLVVSAFAILTGVTGVSGNVLFAGRSFFGVVRVIDHPQEGFRVLQHGTTEHGRQDTKNLASCAPLAYFHPAGPIGQVFRQPGLRSGRIAVVGLGTGALACYPDPGASMTFFEIDPLIERVARDPRLFTYLRNARCAVDVQIGDGRKKLEEAPAAAYHLIVLDAFSSDSVPVHLLTREAFRSYFSRLQSDGIIALHISNRFLDLEPAVAATIKAEGLSAIANLDVRIPAPELRAGWTPSHWVVIARDETLFHSLSTEPGWKPLRINPRIRAWTDDYSNLMQTLKLR